MGRLTKINEDGSVGITELRYYNYDDFQKIAKKLAEYEQAEEDGLLIRLPFEVGSEIYVLTKTLDVMVNEMFYTIKIFKVDKFIYNSLKNFVIVGIEQRSVGFMERHFFLGEIGKTVFLTKAEAEQALAKMKGE